MASKRFDLMVPVQYKGSAKPAYRRVGAVFENQKKDSGETYLTVKLDFPVGVMEMVAFPAKSGDEDETAS